MVSTGNMADRGIESRFRRRDVQLFLEKNNFYLGAGSRQLSTGMYILPHPIIYAEKPNEDSECMALGALENSVDIWHQRLAHLNSGDLTILHKHIDDVPQLTPIKGVCRACRLGKAHKLPFLGHFEDAKALSDVIHSDVVGPIEPSYPDSYRYIATFLDGYTRYTLVVFLKHRSELSEAYKIMLLKLNELGRENPSHKPIESIRRLHSDGAKEYVALQNPLKGSTLKSFSAPYTPAHNGMAERVNRTMLEGALTMLIQENLPTCLWTFAIKHAIYVRKRTPHSATGVTPFSLVTGRKPSLRYLRLFGCRSFVLRLPRASKFDSKAM